MPADVTSCLLWLGGKLVSDEEGGHFFHASPVKHTPSHGWTLRLGPGRSKFSQGNVRSLRNHDHVNKSLTALSV